MSPSPIFFTINVSIRWAGKDTDLIDINALEVRTVVCMSPFPLKTRKEADETVRIVDSILSIRNIDPGLRIGHLGSLLATTSHAPIIASYHNLSQPTITISQ
jgi:hypothetical protein